MGQGERGRPQGRCGRYAAEEIGPLVEPLLVLLLPCACCAGRVGRIFLERVLHCTWFVNSAAHLWGDRPYDPASNPAENPFVAVASLGEGWHNWHHKYPFDYAASEYGITSQFNPTKLIIDVAAACGMVYERKRATAMWTREKAKLQASIKAKAG